LKTVQCPQSHFTTKVSLDNECWTSAFNGMIDEATALCGSGYDNLHNCSLPYPRQWHWQALLVGLCDYSCFKLCICRRQGFYLLHEMVDLKSRKKAESITFDTTYYVLWLTTLSSVNWDVSDHKNKYSITCTSVIVVTLTTITLVQVMTVQIFFAIFSWHLIRLHHKTGNSLLSLQLMWKFQITFQIVTYVNINFTLCLSPVLEALICLLKNMVNILQSNK